MHLRKKDWDINSLVSQISSISRQCSSPHNDGFTAFEIKKDLWELKFLVDEAISKAPKFSGEEEWLTEQEKKRIIKILKS